MQHSYIYAHYRIWNKVQQWEVPTTFQKGIGKMNSDFLHWMERNVEVSCAIKVNEPCSSGETILDKTTCKLMVAIAPAFVIHPERLDATFELVDLDPNRADVDAPQQLVVDILTELKIPHCDLSPALRKANQPYLTFDGHWTLEGHTVVADAIANCWGIP